MRRLLLLCLVAFGCDASDDDGDISALRFQNTDVEARGGARLDDRGATLVVSGIGDSGADGLFLRGDLQAVDLETEAVSLPEGGAFGIRVEDGAGGLVGGFANRDRPGDDGFDFVFEYADGLGVDAVGVSYELGGVVQLAIPRLPLASPKRGRREANAGKGDGDSGSVHTVRRDGRYVVVSDSDAKRGCAGFTVTPPPPFDLEVPQLCADWVEVTPLSGSFPATIGGVAVVGRGLGSFTVTSLSAR